MTRPRIYLDNNASTPVDPRVLKSVVNSLETDIGNSSSIHSFGQETRNHLNKARRTVAEYLSVRSEEIVFTSGGTEGLNMVIRGLFADENGHIITSNIEHSSVFNVVQYLEKQGSSVSWLKAGAEGSISPESVRGEITPATRLVVLSAANSETGVKNDIEEIAKIAHELEVPFVVDAVALLGKEPIVIPEGVSAMCFSGHKIHAPKGIGAAFVRRDLKLTPLLLGAHQEYNRRAGSENIPSIIGFAEAILILQQNPKAYFEIQRLRDRLEEGLKANLPNSVVNGTGSRICNTSNISFLGADGESLLMHLDREGIAVSHGSACISGALQPSRVLLNMGISMEQARSTIRFSLSRFNTEQEIDRCISIVTKAVQNKR